MKEDKPIVIVGAGIAGCVVANELVRNGHKVIVVEKENAIGGLARTFSYNSFSFDIGPHRFYSEKEEIVSYINRILGEDETIIPRNSMVYFLRKYHGWPLRPKVILNLPLEIIAKSCFELIAIILKKKESKAQNFKDYTQKFLGLLPEGTHSDWAKESMKRTIIDERMGSRNLFDILKLTLMFKPLRTDFFYPK